MQGFLKKRNILLRLNSLLSIFFADCTKIRDFRKKIPDKACIIKEPFSFTINFANYYIKSTPYWKKITKPTSQSIYYTEEPNASIVGRGIVINNKNKVLLESTIFQREYLNKLNSHHLILFKNILPQRKIDKVFSVSNRLDNNYFHWTMESLSRILLVYQNPFFTTYKILIAQRTPKFVKESLHFLFHIPEHQIVEKKLIECTKVKKAMVVSFPHIRDATTEMTNVYYPEIIKKFNKLAHFRIEENRAGTRKNYPKNIVISRKKASQRRIVNEAEFIQKLSKYNFVLLYLEELSFAEQVLHFYNAEKIIAVHGAGITNIIYSKHPLLIELFPKERLIRDAFYFAQITAALEFKHIVIEYDSCNKEQDAVIDKTIMKEIINSI